MAYSDKVAITTIIPATSAASEADPNVGTVSSSAGMRDVMKLQMKINPETQVIEEAKFKTFGCGSAIASSSLATEW